jgi:hypothetical protein
VAHALQDVESRGFVVIPNFLSPNDIAFYAREYASRPPAENQNYALREVTFEGIGRLLPRLQSLARTLGARVPIQVDTVYAGVYFAARAVDFQWHQDHESWYLTQDHINQLNFWIPVIKPDRRKTGLCVVDFSEVHRKYPQVWPELIGRGARMYTAEGDQTRVLDESNDEAGVQPFEIESVSQAPEMGVGDLLLMRGDIIHRTQDAETERVAVSFRMANSTGVLRRDAFVLGGEAKLQYQLNNWRSYSTAMACFDSLRTDSVSLAQLFGHFVRSRMGTASAGTPDALGREMLESAIRAARASIAQSR